MFMRRCLQSPLSKNFSPPLRTARELQPRSSGPFQSRCFSNHHARKPLDDRFSKQTSQAKIPKLLRAFHGPGPNPRRVIIEPPPPPPNYRQTGHIRRRYRPLLTWEQIGNFTRTRGFRRGALIVFVLGGVFYVTHIEEVPISGRRRFNCFSEESAEAQGTILYKQIFMQEARNRTILSPRDPRTVRVWNILARLIEGGHLGTGQSELMPGVGWELHVIDEPHTANAFVLPGGKVFVYTGLLPICQTDDGLATVLAHEIAHNIAHHAAEKMSSMVLVQPIVLLLMLLDYTGLTMGMGHYLGSVALELGILRPSSRAQESEADHIGLRLMSESCFHPEAAVGLWQRMELAQKDAPPEWISTHPSNMTRIENIKNWLPQAIDIYEEKGCSKLRQHKGAFDTAIGRFVVLNDIF